MTWSNSPFCSKRILWKGKRSTFRSGSGQYRFYDECSFSINGTELFALKKAQIHFQDSWEFGRMQMKTWFPLFWSVQTGQVVAAMKSAHPYEEVAHQIYSLDNTNHYTGLGMYGDFEEPMEEQDFLKFVKEKFNLEVIRHSDFTRKKIKRVGVLGGSGASGIKSAISKNVMLISREM